MPEDRLEEYLDWLDAEAHAAAVAEYERWARFYRRGLLSSAEWEQFQSAHETALTAGMGRFDMGAREAVTWHMYRPALLAFGAIDESEYEHPYWRV